MTVIPSGFFSKYNDTVDVLLNEPNIGKACKLYYPPKKIACTNCVPVGLPGGGSNSVYRSGGPMPFSAGRCPMCNSANFIEQENTESIKLRIYSDPKNWIKLGVNIQVPDGRVMVIGWTSDIGKMKRAETIRLHSDIQNIARWDYELATECFPHGFGNRFFHAFLDRKE